MSKFTLWRDKTPALPGYPQSNGFLTFVKMSDDSFMARDACSGLPLHLSNQLKNKRYFFEPS